MGIRVRPCDKNRRVSTLEFFASSARLCLHAAEWHMPLDRGYAVGMANFESLAFCLEACTDIFTQLPLGRGAGMEACSSIILIAGLMGDFSSLPSPPAFLGHFVGHRFAHRIPQPG